MESPEALMAYMWTPAGFAKMEFAMGQAALDLPDHLSLPDNGPAVDADDLLSQLAGDEIDRLLAEGDVEAPQVEAADPVPVDPVPSPTLVDEPITPELNSSGADEILDSVTPETVTPEPSTPEIKAQLSNELDQLLDTINNPDASPLPQLATPAENLDQDLTASAEQLLASCAESTITAAIPAADAHSTPENTNPSPPQESGNSDEMAATAALLDSIEPSNPPAPLPIWLRPLEWLNAPAAGFSDTTRSMLGKVALVTLFNAIVVLLYVLLFRHR